MIARKRDFSVVNLEKTKVNSAVDGTSRYGWSQRRRTGTECDGLVLDPMAFTEPSSFARLRQADNKNETFRL
jgi:hypothetical protein